MGDEEVPVALDAAMTGEVDEERVVGCRLSESLTKCGKDGLACRLPVGEDSHARSCESPILRSQELGHLSHVSGDGGQLVDGSGIVADANDQRSLPATLRGLA